MGLFGGIAHQGAQGALLQAGFSAAEIKAAVPRGFESDDGCNRRAADNQAAGSAWEFKKFTAPLHDLFFHIHRAMVAPTEVGIEGRSGDICHQIARCSRAMHPAKKPRMGVAYAIGQQGGQVVLGRLCAYALSG